MNSTTRNALHFSIGIDKSLQGQELPYFFLVIRSVDVVADIIFWIDIVITFVTARWKIQTVPICTWILVEDLARFFPLPPISKAPCKASS